MGHYNLSTEKYISLAQKIVEAANSAFHTDIYTLEQIEIVSALRDYQDGKGPQIVSVAALRNPVDQSYDVRVDLLDGPEEALIELLKIVDVMIDKTENHSKLLN